MMTEQPPPKEINGARLIGFTIARDGADFGVSHDQDMNQDIPITALAICRYPEESDSVYLFACDANWIVRGDLLYNTKEEAMSDAERYYETEPLTWIKYMPRNNDLVFDIISSRKLAR